MITPPLLADFARPLLVLHALLAVVTLGSSMHLGVVGALVLLRRRAPVRILRLHARIAPVAYAATFALGLVIYPAFRVLVRGIFLDRYEPWASNAFDMKEALVLVGLPVAAAILLAGRAVDDEDARPFVAALGIALACVVLAAAVLGLVVTSVKGPA